MRYPELSGQQSHCRACRLSFKSTAAFDAHRVGSFKDATRRCMSAEELTAAGFEPDKRGFLRVPFDGHGAFFPKDAAA